MSRVAVLCVGRVYCDVVFSGLSSMPTPGNEMYADGLSLQAGGGAAITAFYLAQLGQEVELCANLPAAPFCEVLREQLGECIGLELCSTPAQVEPQITVVLTGAIDRSFVTRRVGQALPADCSEKLASSESVVAAVTHVHIGELATLLEHPELITLARSNNWSISLDCAWDESAMSNPAAAQLIKSVDLFMPNELEFVQLKKIGIDETSVPLTVVKKGADGAQAFVGELFVDSSAVPAQCVDSTGAGDAFDAGFIHAWLQKMPIEACLASGNKCGALAVGRLGGIGRSV